MKCRNALERQKNKTANGRLHFWTNLFYSANVANDSRLYSFLVHRILLAMWWANMFDHTHAVLHLQMYGRNDGDNIIDWNTTQN